MKRKYLTDIKEITMEQLELFDFGNEKFWSYHRNNPQIYKAFRLVALLAIEKGFKHFSAEAIFNIVRWETPVSATTDAFKINNNYKSFYSRLFCVDYPQYSEFFFRRRSKADSMIVQSSKSMTEKYFDANPPGSDVDNLPF